MFSIICLIHFVWMKNGYYLTKKPDQIKLPNWVNVGKERFNEMLSTITKAQSDVLKTNVDGRECRKFTKRHRQCKNKWK